MKKFWFIPFAIVLFFVANTFISDSSFAQTSSQSAPPGIPFTPQAQPKMKNVDRIGVNLGPWISWGASQFMKNILMNPGFESQIDRFVVIVTQSDNSSFSDTKDWGMPDGTWTGAAYEVRTGQSAGIKGTISNSLAIGAGGFPQYFTDSTTPPLAPKDVIVLSRVGQKDKLNGWWIDNTERVWVDASQVRPGSLGSQSLNLKPTASEPAVANTYIDAIPDRAGKLLLIQGAWRFSVWAKAASPNASLQVNFSRLNGTTPFFTQTINPTTDWQFYTYDFTATDDGPPQVVRLSLTAQSADNGEIWLDDIYLGPAQNSPSAFRDEVVKVLKDMRPSFIRQYGALGDAMDNMIADPTSRKSTSFRIAGNIENGEVSYGYSLPEFLDLCQLVGANPWLIVPVTFSPEEYLKFGAYLAQNAPKSRFSEVIVEFGNENWNWVFRPLALPYPDVHGVVGTMAFDNILAGAGNNVAIRTVVNGQAVNPAYSTDFLKGVSNANTIAIAPYFFYRLDQGTPQSTVLTELSQDDGGLMVQMNDSAVQLGKNMAVYEVNLHTTQGNAPHSERDPVVAGAAAGVALAKRLIESMLAGANPVMVYDLSQYDSSTWDIPDFVKLWGITRDIGVTGRIRPQGLIVKMLNQVIGGDLYKADPLNAPTPESNDVTMVTFKTPDSGWTAAALSIRSAPIDLSIQFPDDGSAIPTTMQVLTFSSPYDTNEDNENVTITSQIPQTSGRIVSFTVPAYGLVTLGNLPAPKIDPNLPPPTPPESIPTPTPAGEPTPLPPAPTPLPPAPTPLPPAPTPLPPAPTPLPPAPTPLPPAPTPLPPAPTPLPPAPTPLPPAPTPLPPAPPQEPPPSTGDRIQQLRKLRQEYRMKLDQLRQDYQKKLRELEQQFPSS